MDALEALRPHAAAVSAVGDAGQLPRRVLSPKPTRAGVNIGQGLGMGRVKKAVLDLVKRMLDDCTFEDVQYQLYVRQKIERGLEAADTGRVVSHEQVKKRLSKWLGR
jgi:hypothetical protein